jgi:predicted nucleic acid-binding protein
MIVALDTNRYSDLMRGVPEVVEFLGRADKIYLPFGTIAELRSGFSMGSKGRTNEQVLSKFLARSDVASLYPDQETTRLYAAIYRQLRTQGTPIPTNDIWIAAIIIQHDLTLYARDAHFDCLAQLRRG